MSLRRKEYMTYRERMEERYNEPREAGDKAGYEVGYKEEHEIGYKEGYEIGIKEAISGTVNILRSMNIDDNTIVIKLCEQYKLTESEAKEYMHS